MLFKREGHCARVQMNMHMSILMPLRRNNERQNESRRAS